MIALSKIAEKDRYVRLGNSLKYAFYCIFHPFDGYWCLMREKRGTLAAANVIVIGLILAEIFKFTVTTFQFISVTAEYFNVIFTILSILAPLLLWTVSNWGFTTLMEGKGRLKDIYIGTAYAFIPYVIINFVMAFFSNLMTTSEFSIYSIICNFAIVWSVLLMMIAMMQIHDYTVAKTVASSILTLVGIMIMIFIFLLFFSLISDGFAYFVSLYREFMFRLI